MRTRSRIYRYIGAVSAGLTAFIAVGATWAETADADLLDMVVQGRRQALSSIHSGKGRAVLHFRHNRSDGVTETNGTYDVAFTENKFKELHEVTFLRNESADESRNVGPYLPGAKFTYETSYDGERAVSRDHTNKSALIRDYPLPRERRIRDMLLHEPLCRFMDVDNIDVLYPRDAVEKTGLRVARRESLNGDECVVLQLSSVQIMKDESRVSWSWEFWVSPAKGFSLPKAQGFAQGGRFGESRKLITDLNTEVRQQEDGAWAPVKFTSLNYLIDDSGISSLGVEYTLTFDPAFQFNIPVSGDDLKINLPSGTNVNDELLNMSYRVP